MSLSCGLEWKSKKKNFLFDDIKKKRKQTDKQTKNKRGCVLKENFVKLIFDLWIGGEGGVEGQGQSDGNVMKM